MFHKFRPIRRRWLFALTACSVATFCGVPATSDAAEPVAPAERYTVETTDEGATIHLDGKLLTKYVAHSKSKPILWPLIGPGGAAVTRGYPMQDAIATEKADHPHHRSFWMTHGEVNGVDFWAEGEGKGQIVADGAPEVKGGENATLVAKHNWLAPDGKRVMADKWELTFGANDSQSWIDCVFSLTATDGDVVFGDTKEGSFGIRVAGTIKMDGEGKGNIVNAEGVEGKATWAKSSAWVDYYGPVEGKTQGIAILNHPSSFGYPTRWHVRSYGLFAANPFGVHHFIGGDETEGTLLPAGETLKLVYRVILHDGSTKAADIPAQWKAYSETTVK